MRLGHTFFSPNRLSPLHIEPNDTYGIHLASDLTMRFIKQQCIRLPACEGQGHKVNLYVTAALLSRVQV